MRCDFIQKTDPVDGMPVIIRRTGPMQDPMCRIYFFFAKDGEIIITGWSVRPFFVKNWKYCNLIQICILAQKLIWIYIFNDDFGLLLGNA